MGKVRITAVRQTVYADLMERYENPIEHTCDVRVGQEWISVDGERPEGLCPSAWDSMRPFVEALARGEGNFYDGWMKDPMSALISCNDGFRPFSFYLEAVGDEASGDARADVPAPAEAPAFRPMRRMKQQLEEGDCMAILSSAMRGVLSVVGDGGYPYGVPINFVYDDGKLYFHCAKEGHKLDAIRACDKTCFTVLDEPQKEPGDWWYHVRSVVCFGTMRIVEDEAERMTRLRMLGRKYFPDGYDLEGDLRRSGPNAEMLEMTIVHMTGKRVREK